MLAHLGVLEVLIFVMQRSMASTYSSSDVFTGCVIAFGLAVGANSVLDRFSRIFSPKTELIKVKK